MILNTPFFFFFFFNDTATTEIYTLSLHDALPIYQYLQTNRLRPCGAYVYRGRSENLHATLDHYRNMDPQAGGQHHGVLLRRGKDRKSTRLNSSHSQISYAVFCLKKKNKNNSIIII